MTPAIQTLVARTPAELAAGMRGRAPLALNQGMLFVHPHTGFFGYTMRGVDQALDIVWLDKNFRVAGITNAQPCDFEPCPVYTPPAPIMFALELASSAAKHYGIRIAQQLVAKGLN